MQEFDRETEYGRLHIYQKGTGDKVVLLLHGSGCDNAMLSWAEVMQRFSAEYTVYAPDLLGYGKSDKPAGLCGEQFYAVHIQAIRQMTEQLGLTAFTLAGLSMGGAIAIGYALRYPAQVKTLIPVDSWGLSPTLPLHRFCYWYIHKTNFTLLQYRWLAKSKRMAKWMIRYSLIGDPHKVTDPLVDAVLAACRGDSAGKAMQDYQRSSCSKTAAVPFYQDELRQLAMPVIFVHGTRDPLVPVKLLDGIEKRVPHAKVCLLEGCKHWSVKEKPDTFFALVQSST